ncbi:PTS system IIA component (Glc family) [Orenia metallireducens]|jgi:PTS system glucose-specific IIA component|uniref:PTS system IIA component, Glc family n=1 Tax=Orenia metallireducens TaxID=1413210 RepID=A0A285I3W3_9FIRM|nr:PTS glucose transporter subunit IIA [Orenia metallireducens]PRX23149.1 PTS system IIA component (Glc family) [Orenia metallireducens]SNY42650.1 PTS system IIA component, Glc family [Orenia metallireducens]
MFKKLFKSQPKIVEIFSPLNGDLIDLSEVPDPVFSQKMVGDGFAVIPNDGKLISPVKGKIKQVLPTKHAIGIETVDGLELLIHVGLETVELEGEGFEVLVKVGDSVEVGDQLLNFDIDFIEDNNKEIITPIVVTNYQEKIKKFCKVANSEINCKELVLKCELV